MVTVKKVEEAPTEEAVAELVVEEKVEEVLEEVPEQVEPATVAPQFTQVFDDVVSSVCVFHFILFLHFALCVRTC